MRTLIVISTIAGILSGCASTAEAMSRGRVAVDPVTASSILDEDTTGLIEGCGQQVQVGITHCRLEEGSAADRSVWFIGPPAKCDREACVFFKVFNGQGQLAWGGSLAKGTTRVEVPWKTLLGQDTFQMGSRGLWSWLMVVYWKDPDGRERESTAKGDLVIRIYRKGYVPLEHVEQDPNFVWEWTEGGRVYRMTSGLRTFVGAAK